VQFDNAYIFKYSQRRDTPAAGMPTRCRRKSAKKRIIAAGTGDEIAARNMTLHRAGGADFLSKAKQEKRGALHRTHALQSHRAIRRQRPPSRDSSWT